jgi:hypothetical protein
MLSQNETADAFRVRGLIISLSTSRRLESGSLKVDPAMDQYVKCIEQQCLCLRAMMLQ